MDKIKAVLVDGVPSNSSKMYKALQSMVDTYCSITYFDNLSEADNHINKNSSVIDIILLDLTWLQQEKKLPAFEKIRDASNQTPILVFTKRSNHDLAKILIGKGAADNVVAEVLDENPYRLRDAIVFSLARHKILLEIKSKAEEDVAFANDQHKQIIHLLSGGYVVSN